MGFLVDSQNEALKIAFSGQPIENILEKEGSPLQREQQQQQEEEEGSNHHKVAGLSCVEYGGPSDEAAAEMVYWRDIPSDATFTSPYKAVGPSTKYLTFEPDEGGWNNIRMVRFAVSRGLFVLF